MPLDSFSYSINIKRFQNLLETAADDAERQTIQKLLNEEQSKTVLRDPERKKD